MTSPGVKCKEVTFSPPTSFKLYGGSSSAGAVPSSRVVLPHDVIIESKKLEVACRPAIVSHQTRPAPLPPKQPKYIVNRVSSKTLNDDLKKIVSCVSRGQRSNIDDFTKGHLNETHLLPAIPVHLGDPREKRWGGYEEDLPKPQAPKTKPRKKPSTRKAEQANMQFALQEFVTRTAGLNDMLSSVFNDQNEFLLNNSDNSLEKVAEGNEDQDIENETNRPGKAVLELITESIETLDIYDAETTMRGSYRPNPQDPFGPKWNEHPQVEEIKPGELKLPKLKKIKKPSETPSLPDTPGSTKFFTSHLYAATKKDQFSGWLGFQQRVLNVSDAKEVKLVSNNLAAKYYKQKLNKLLTSLPSKVYRSRYPCLEKVQAHGRIWDDLVKDSPIFGPVLAAIKLEYETYINHLSEHEQLKIQSGSLENEVTGLLTGAGQGHLFGSMALGDEGAPGPFEADLVAEEEFRNLELEAEYQFLLENNQKAHEQIKSERRKLEARKEAFRERLLETDSKSSSEHMSECDLLVGLRDEIVDTMLRIEEVNSQVKHHMVPLSLTQSIRTLTQQDKKSIENYSEMCERVIELCTATGKEMNEQLGKAVINPFEVKMIWRKLKTMTSVCKYTLASSSANQNTPPVMTSEGTSSDLGNANKVIEDTVNISQQDVEAVLAEEEDEILRRAEDSRPESSRREDFDFYF